MADKLLRRAKKIPMILSVSSLDGHRLHIEFGSRSLLELNMENRLRTTRYYPLNDPTVFHSASTDGSKISFETGTTFELEMFPREAVNIALRAPGEGMLILRVQPVENTRIRLFMASGSMLELNMESHLQTACYSRLKDAELFRSVRTDGESLIFGDILQINEEELTVLALTETFRCL